MSVNLVFASMVWTGIPANVMLASAASTVKSLHSCDLPRWSVTTARPFLPDVQQITVRTTVFVTKNPRTIFVVAATRALSAIDAWCWRVFIRWAMILTWNYPNPTSFLVPISPLALVQRTVVVCWCISVIWDIWWQKYSWEEYELATMSAIRRAQWCSAMTQWMMVSEGGESSLHYFLGSRETSRTAIDQRRTEFQSDRGSRLYTIHQQSWSTSLSEHQRHRCIVHWWNTQWTKYASSSTVAHPRSDIVSR